MAPKEEKLYVIEKILKKRVKKGIIEYNIKWLGYGPHQNSWEPIECLEGAQDALQEFEEMEKLKEEITLQKPFIRSFDEKNTYSNYLNEKIQIESQQKQNVKKQFKSKNQYSSVKIQDTPLKRKQKLKIQQQSIVKEESDDDEEVNKQDENRDKLQEDLSSNGINNFSKKWNIDNEQNVNFTQNINRQRKLKLSDLQESTSNKNNHQMQKRMEISKFKDEQKYIKSNADQNQYEILKQGDSHKKNQVEKDNQIKQQIEIQNLKNNEKYLKTEIEMKKIIENEKIQQNDIQKQKQQDLDIERQIVQQNQIDRQKERLKKQIIEIEKQAAQEKQKYDQQIQIQQKQLEKQQLLEIEKQAAQEKQKYDQQIQIQQKQLEKQQLLEKEKQEKLVAFEIQRQIELKKQHEQKLLIEKQKEIDHKQTEKQQEIQKKILQKKKMGEFVKELQLINPNLSQKKYLVIPIFKNLHPFLQKLIDQKEKDNFSDKTQQLIKYIDDYQEEIESDYESSNHEDLYNEQSQISIKPHQISPLIHELEPVIIKKTKTTQDHINQIDNENIVTRQKKFMNTLEPKYSLNKEFIPRQSDYVVKYKEQKYLRKLKVHDVGSFDTGDQIIKIIDVIRFNFQDPFQKQKFNYLNDLYFEVLWQKKSTQENIISFMNYQTIKIQDPLKALQFYQDKVKLISK